MKKIILGFALLVILQNTCGQTKVIAHRGYWDCNGSAKNSLVALHKAHEQRVYGSEFDVWLTADGVAVINHDDTIQSRVIETATYEQIRDARLINGEILPTLEQFLIHGKACMPTQLIVEIKPHKTAENEKRAVSTVVNLIKQHGLEARVEYISFSMNICRELLLADSLAKVAYLAGDVPPAELKKAGLTGLDYHHQVLKDHPDWIVQARKLGLTTNVWTVNKAEDMEFFVGAGVDYITTDKPLLMMKILKNKKVKK
ncbi:MAG: glycerophosphodiester phosphodiesterase [Bacteroidetes bacterium]|nr:glycerophosphodiester phosphodiesterase [Bacteroidota bacterium]